MNRPERPNQNPPKWIEGRNHHKMIWHDLTQFGFMNHLKLHAESMWKGKVVFFLPLPYQGFPWCFGWWTWSLVERQNITNTCTHAETETESPSLRMRAGQCTFQWCLQWFFSDEAALKKNNHLWICDCDAELIKDNLKTTLTDSDSPLRPANLFFGVEVQGKTEMRAKELARIYFRSLEKNPGHEFPGSILAGGREMVIQNPWGFLEDSWSWRQGLSL